jgi:drug/metabolite transporter (DMT)-like permease
MELRVRGGAVLSVAVGGALIGLAPIAIRLSDLGPLATNLWRFLFALPILAVWASQTRPAPGRRDVNWLLVAGLFFGAELNVWAISLTQTTVANATLLTNMTPIFAAAFGWFVFKERVAPGVLVGGAIALIGAVTLAIARSQSAMGPTGAEAGWLGDAMALMSAVGYAAYLLIVRSLGSRVSAGAVMFWGSLSGLALTLAACLVTREPLLPHSRQGWLILIGLGVVVQTMGQGFIAYGVARLPIVISTVLLWTQPLAAAALSWILFSERLGAVALIGAALILAGLYQVQRSRQ